MLFPNPNPLNVAFDVVAYRHATTTLVADSIRGLCCANAMTIRSSVWCAVLIAASIGCKKSRPDDEHGAAPPPIASSKAGACAAGGGTVADPVAGTFFPATAGDYCVDPHGEVRAYGKDASGSLDQVCTELFDGEC